MFDPGLIKPALVLPPPPAALDLRCLVPWQDIKVAPSVKKIALKLEKTCHRAHSRVWLLSKGILEN